MKQLLQRILFAWRYKRAIRKAQKLADLFGLKYYVIYLNGGIKVVPKRTIKQLIHQHRFRRGVRIQDIERRALFIATPHTKSKGGTPCS